MQCTHIKPDGSQCRSHAVKNRQFCWFHDPDGKRSRLQANSLGGKAYSAGIYAPLPPVNFKNFRDTTGLLIDTLNQMRSGKIGTRAAIAMAHIYKLLRQWLDSDEGFKESEEILHEASQEIYRRWKEHQKQIKEHHEQEGQVEEEDQVDDLDQDEDQDEDE
jgi:ABC-type transporter lipoprotein component MlaA